MASFTGHDHVVELMFTTKPKDTKDTKDTYFKIETQLGGSIQKDQLSPYPDNYESIII